MIEYKAQYRTGAIWQDIGQSEDKGVVEWLLSGFVKAYEVKPPYYKPIKETRIVSREVTEWAKLQENV